MSYSNFINGNRSLTIRNHLVDFCSNDYLGLAKNLELKEVFLAKLSASQDVALGASGARLISGNSRLHEELEDLLATFFHAEACLFFNSGYQANLGLFSTLAGRHDTIIYDADVHASIRDGIYLARCKSSSFSHNCSEDLEKKLRLAQGDKYVVVEGLYSMSGDYAPISKIIEKCKKYKAKLIVDEAHSGGILGQGAGLCVEEALESEVFARVFAFGKAFGSAGAVVAGSPRLKHFLINSARSFIYTTAVPDYHVLALLQVFASFGQFSEDTKRLWANIDYLHSKLQSIFERDKFCRSPIFPFPLGDKTAEVLKRCSEANLGVYPVRSPTVKKGKEILRISVHSYNTKEEIDKLLESYLM